MIKKDFTVGELFRLVRPAGSLSTKQLLDGNDIPYVASKKLNNGVQKMCSVENIPSGEIMKGNCIVFVQRGNGAGGSTTYQPNDFYAIPCVCCGYIDGVLNENIGLYLVTILDKNKGSYGHGNPWTGERLTNTPIPLPVKVDTLGEPVFEDGQYVPDWDFIDSFIGKIKHESYKKVVERLSSEL